jgi:hypothetical protein
MIETMVSVLQHYGLAGVVIVLVAFILLKSRIVIEYRGWRSQEIEPVPKRKKIE